MCVVARLPFDVLCVCVVQIIVLFVPVCLLCVDGCMCRLLLFVYVFRLCLFVFGCAHCCFGFWLCLLRIVLLRTNGCCYVLYVLLLLCMSVMCV